MPRKAENHRRSIRLAGFDYRDDGTYFVTVCTNDREHLFGEIRNGVMGLNECGRVVADCIEQIPHHFPGITINEYVVMPNHVHLLMHIDDDQSRDGRGMACHAPTATTVDGASSTSRKSAVPSLSATTIDDSTPSFGKPQSRSLSTIVGAFKSAVTKRTNELRGSDTTVWQRNFHEHIVRDSDERERIERYIQNNPAHWQADEFHL